MSSFKTSDDAYKSLKTNFENRIGDSIQTGSVIDTYNKVIADECSEMYQYIEDSKNPYLFTRIYGDSLDDLSYWTQLTREDGESDEHFKYRLKDWVLSSEASNTTAIENSLLLTKVSSNIQYVPYTHGSGTGTCYVVPKHYDEENIRESLEEAERLLKDAISPSLYVEYIVPAMRGVKLNCFLSTSGDANTIKENIITSLQNHINSIEPGKYLNVGDLLKLGLNENGVEYFNIIDIYIDEEKLTDIRLIQELETKLLFDEIIWSGTNE